MTERIITVRLRACAGPPCFDFILPLFKNSPHRGKFAEYCARGADVRRTPSISAAQENAGRIGAKVRG